MEYVDGRSITDFADQRRLTVEQRLELFLQVCDAVQHAHQKGLLHRDLKPGNILVADLDGRGVAKVIDFGIAKAIGQRLARQTVATEMGAFVGTPEYMSPEQAGLLDVDVDTRTDIFSLGIVLYELLVGATPYKTPQHRSTAVLEMLRAVREEEPPRLTRRLTSLGAAAAREIAQRRHVEPGALKRLLRGDLEWIAAKAIEKEPSRRYASASELAADVRRYLDSDPVTAGPPDLLYRLRKLTRKHRGSAIVAAVATSIVIAASVMSTFFWIRSEQARRETRRQLVSLHVAEGMRLVDDNDSLRALPWLAEALGMEPDGEAAEEVHRRRIAMILDRTPALSKVWTFGAGVVGWDVSPDRTWLALATTGGELRIVDMEGGSVSASRERHDGRINAVVISRDGRWIASVGADGFARRWNRALDASGPPVRHGGVALSIAISPEGTRVATIGDDQAAHVWDAGSGALLFSLVHDSRVRAIGFSRDGRLIATGSRDTVMLWDASIGQSVGQLRHSRPIDLIRFSEDGRLAVAANNTVRLWTLIDRQPIGEEIRQTNPIYQLTFSADSRWVAWGSSGNIFGVIDARTGALATPMLRRPDQVVDVAFSADGQHLASLELGGHIQLWRTGTWQSQPLVVRGDANARTLFFDRSGRRLVSCGEAGALVWDLAAASSSDPLMPHTAAVRDLSIAADGRTLVTTSGVLGSRDNFVRVWTIDSSEPVAPPLREGGFIRAVVDGRGQRIATGGEDGRARVWDAQSGEPVGPPLVHGRYIVGVAFSGDGRFLATAGGNAPIPEQGSTRDGDVRLWDIASGQARWRRSFTAGIAALALTTDGTRLAIGTTDGGVTFWNASGERLAGEVRHGALLYKIAVSANGRWSVSVSERGAHVWDHLRNEGRWLEPKPGISVSYDSRNTLVAIGTFDGAVSIWNLETGASLGPGMEPGGMIYSARFDHGDRYIATASMNGSTRVWDVTGRPVSPRLQHDGPVWSARFTPDGRKIASAGGATARLWDFPIAGGTAG